MPVIGNGELYDHRALRRDLERRGHTFRTGSRHRGLVHLYEERGPAFVRRAARDVRAGAVGRARAAAACSRAIRSGSSRSSTRTARAAGSAFACELKALLALPGFPREVDPEALEAYLALNAVPAPPTIFRAARKLRARAPADRRSPGRARRALRAAAPVAGRRAAPRVARRARRRAARAAGELRARAPRRRRAGRRAALRRRRLGPGHGACGRPGGPEDVQRRLRRRGFDELARRAPVAERYGTDHHELRLGPADAVDARGRRGDATTSRRATRPRCPTGCWRASRRGT